MRSLQGVIDKVVSFGLDKCCATPLQFAPFKTLDWLRSALVNSLDTTNPNTNSTNPNNNTKRQQEILALFPSLLQDLRYRWFSMAAANTTIASSPFFDVGSALLELPVRSLVLPGIVSSVAGESHPLVFLLFGGVFCVCSLDEDIYLF